MLRHAVTSQPLNLLKYQSTPQPLNVPKYQSRLPRRCATSHCSHACLCLCSCTDCELARHGLRTASHWALAGGDDGGEGGFAAGGGEEIVGEEGGGGEQASPLAPPVRYSRDAFEGFAHLYEQNMYDLAYRAQVCVCFGGGGRMLRDVAGCLGTVT